MSRRILSFGRKGRTSNSTDRPTSPSPTLDSEQHPPAGGSAMNILSSEYARRRKELMELTSYLRSIGAETLIDLPRIVVIGGQSAGKSSLVEAVTGINVPRDSGTCTRCPMECTIASTSVVWSCRISLRFDYDPDTGRSLSTSHTIPFGPEKIHDKSQVEIWLRRAQVAILSPHVDTAIFLNKSRENLMTYMKDEKDKIKKFEKNKICIDIEDPDATDLAFVDLPGLIQNESEDTIALVRSLVEANIKNDNTIILVAIPVSDDMENQQSVLLARKADPQGQRTIGVLTKPDTLPSGATSARQKWKDIIEGREHRLTHGYYCVKLPDDDERARGISRAEAEQSSKQFLDFTPPWSDVADRRRFGIQNLINDVSKLLMIVIERALPQIKRKISELLLETGNALSLLPDPPGADAASEILLQITQFSNEIRLLIYGGGDDKTFIQQNREAYERFKLAIRSTAPDFRPSPMWIPHPSVSDPLRRRPDGEDDDIPCPQISPMDLKDVRDVIQSSIDWHLPNHVPFEANKILIKRFVDLWDDPVLSVFEEVSNRLDTFVETLVAERFSQFRNLETLIRVSISKELEDIRDDAKNEVLKELGLEKRPYFTQNIHYLTSTRQNWLQRFIVTPGIIEIPHTFEQEFKLMADVRAYFQVAYKRIIDNIPLRIEHALNQTFSDNLQSCLFQELKIGTATMDEDMKYLLMEDPEIALSREQLELKRERLLDIQSRFLNFSLR